jgi:two-component system chemotaxis response regulator CheY
VLLEQYLRLDVSGEAGSSEELLALTRAACPDLVVLDWDLPGLEPASLVRIVRGQCLTVKVIVISGRAEARPAATAAGADVFVSKGVAPESLMAAIRACCAQRFGTDPAVRVKEAESGREISSPSLRSADDA